jgi:hypothetical protein
MSILRSSFKKKLARMIRPIEASPIYVYGSDEPYLFAEKLPPVMQFSSTFKQNAEILKKSACEHKIISLSFNQIFMEYKGFVYYEGIRNGFNKWHCGEEEKKLDEYKLIINPQINGVKRVKIITFN